MSVRAILEALILDGPCSGIEEREDGFLACFPEGTSLSAVRRIVTAAEERVESSGILEPYDISVKEIPFMDWSVHWIDRFSPVETGERLVIMAPWHTVTEKRIPIVIEPSMAFGTGDHPTTRLCLEAVEECAGNARSESLLDIGTGTGILAIAAAKLGFRFVTAIDSDPVAVEIARKNITINNTPEVVVSAVPLHAVPGPFDVIVGNLTSDTLKALWHDSADRLSRGGTCIFSGILHAKRDGMLSFLEERDIRNIAVRERDGWCALVFRR